MNILVGLGNPGKKYSDTKHNFGYWIIDKYAQKNNFEFMSGKGDYLIAKKEETACIKPTTFMNNSGLAILDAKQFFKVKIDNIFIIYDDIDLPLGLLRFKKKGSAGGHKGIESIIYHLQSDEFNRLRVGIATNENMKPSEKFVLSPFLDRDKKLINESIEKACDGISFFLSHGITKTMNKYNEKKQEIN